jgi:hypothetical protein
MTERGVESRLWGEIKREKLPKKIDINNLKQVRPFIVDEPLLPTIIKIENNQNNHSKKFRVPDDSDQFNIKNKNESHKIQLRPSIDSYIINTIKLNQILNYKIPFEQVDFFTKKKMSKTETGKKMDRKNIRVNNDQVVRHYLKKFVTVLSLHCGFNGN